MTQSENINIAILKYASTQMNSQHVTSREYDQLHDLVSNIINRYYPLWDCFEED